MSHVFFTTLSCRFNIKDFKIYSHKHGIMGFILDLTYHGLQRPMCPKVLKIKGTGRMNRTEWRMTSSVM